MVFASFSCKRQWLQRHQRVSLPFDDGEGSVYSGREFYTSCIGTWNRVTAISDAALAHLRCKIAGDTCMVPQGFAIRESLLANRTRMIALGY
jgi:hypothetical protein